MYKRMDGHIFRCQICKQEIQQGKILNCHHVFCHRCFQDNYVKNNLSDKIICPVKNCKRATSLPSRNINDMNNFEENEITAEMKRISVGEELTNMNPKVDNSSFEASNASRKVASAPPAIELPEITLPEASVSPISKLTSSSFTTHEASTPSPPSSNRNSLNIQSAPSPPTSNRSSLIDKRQSSGHRHSEYVSLLQTPEQVAALKKKRAQFMWQMSVPDETSPPEFHHDDPTDGNQHKVLTRSASHQPEYLSYQNSVIRDNRPRYESVLTTDEQRAALLKKRAQMQHMLSKEPPQEPPEPESEKPKTKGFRTRNSKSPKDKNPRVNIMRGSLGAFLIAAKVTETEFRERREGPWGYQDKDHWDGRSWGELDD